MPAEDESATPPLINVFSYLMAACRGRTIPHPPSCGRERQGPRTCRCRSTAPGAEGQAVLAGPCVCVCECVCMSVCVCVCVCVYIYI